MIKHGRRYPNKEDYAKNIKMGVWDCYLRDTSRVRVTCIYDIFVATVIQC